MVYVPHVNVVIVGSMASGKTTLLKEFINRGYNPIISCTTRPKRRGEKDGVDYYFVSDEAFDAGAAWEDFAAVRSYKTVDGVWRYGIGYKNIPDDKDNVFILDPEGLMDIETKIPNVFGVYLDVDEDIRMERALSRAYATNENISEIQRRFADDRNVFGGDRFGSPKWYMEHCKIRCWANHEYTRTTVEEADRIERFIKLYKKELRSNHEGK